MSTSWSKRTLWQAFAAVAQRQSGHRAVLCDGEKVTYGELAKLAERAARGLVRIGIQPDDKVALWAPNSVSFLAITLGATRIGAVVVPVNTRLRAEEVAYTLQQSESVALVLQQRHGQTDFVQLLDSICPDVRRARVGQITSEAFPFLKHAVCLDAEPPGFWTYAELLRTSAAAHVDDDMRLRAAEANVTPDDLAFIQYTSGSTAFPKGAMLSHNSVVRNAWHFGEALVLQPSDVYVSPMPFFHVGGLVTAALCCFVHGATLVAQGHFDAEHMLRLIEAERATVLGGVETNFLMAMDHPGFAAYDLSSLHKCIVLGTGEFVQRVHDEMRIPSVCTLYGISEASPNVSIVRVGEPLEVSLRTMGRPQPEVEVRIVDLDTDAPLAAGEQGEICVRGWNVMQGYYNNPQETARAIDADGWLHTGDLGTLDQQGYLVFLGRIKNVIRVGGENVSAEDVENVLGGHPKVKLAQVVGAPDPRLQEVCVAYVELKEGQAATAEDLISYCRERLATFKVPRRIRFTDDWPMTGSGKVQRFKLRERELQLAQASLASAPGVA
ncbi:MAG: AMP-binding protein [Chloroflexi bacterium]|nr:AMP-binding protein [Chloroflexota bacterium]